ncbi:hypothetical protein [Clostridium sp. JNZ J1-5]
MSNIEYLDEEEQFKEILNNEEINRIKDPKLRNIRLKYWNLLHKTFLDEHKMPDSMIEQEIEKIKAAEIKEFEEYRHYNKKG